jgi:uncharacterized DUF497 family protein
VAYLIHYVSLKTDQYLQRGHGEVIRIISARKATQRESAFYQGG